MTMSVRSKLRALLLRTRPTMPAPAVMRAPRTSAQAGYAATVGEANPSTTFAKPMESGTVLG